MLSFLKKKKPETQEASQTVSAIPKPAVESEKPLEVPYMPTIQSIRREGIETYWKKPEKSSGYEIYRSYDPEEIGELAKVIDNKLIGVWTDSTFDRQHKEIFYRVRSFLNEKDGSVRYSDFSEQFSAKYREELELEREVTYLHSKSRRILKAFHGWGEVDDAQWSTSDERIAVVDARGVITGISKGECDVTCISPSLGVSQTAKVVVDRSAPEPLSEITSRYEYDPESGIWEGKEQHSEDGAIIMMVGDMMCGKGQIQKQYSEEEGWNFNGSFDYVREITAESDFTIGNLETLLDPAWPYMTDEWFINNISNCNAPPRYLDAIKYGGFDGVIMANNHSCDGGVLAIKSTIDQVEHYQLAWTGAFRNKDERRFFIVNINGIKVGFLAYMSLATGYNGKDRRWTKEEKDIILNNYTKERAVKDIADCKAAGAEYIIVYMHWGQKNFRNPTEVQIEEAKGVADAGADYIVGSNPHVLEKYDVVKASDGRTVPCFYSVGNFHARMKQVTGNRDSVIVKIKLERGKKGEILLKENTYIPCFTYSNVGESYLAPVSVSTMYHEGMVFFKPEDKHKRIRKAIGKKIKPCDMYYSASAQEKIKQRCSEVLASKAPAVETPVNDAPESETPADEE